MANGVLFMKSLHRQKGLTTISIAVILAMLAFFVALALATLPVYYDQFTVSSQVEGLEEVEGLSKMSESQILDRLMKRFQIDNVKAVREEDIEINKNPDKLEVLVNYEVRKSFIGNIDLVLYFDNEYKIPYR